MVLKILNDEEASPYIYKTNLIAYSDSFAGFVEKAYGHKRTLIGIRDEGELRAVLPVFIGSGAFGLKKAEVPFFIYTEILFVDPDFKINGGELGRELVEFLGVDVLRLNFYKIYHPDQFDVSGFDSIFTAMVATLRGHAGYDDYLANVLSRNSRSKIYKSYSTGLEFCELKAGDLSEFHELYYAHVKTMGTKPHPVEYFRKMIESYDFGKDLFMHGARHNCRLVSANLFVLNRDYLEVRFLADDVNFRNLFPNNFLYAELIKWSFANGVNYIDFGGIPLKMRSNIEFKMSFGAKEFPVYTKYFYRNSFSKLKYKLGKKMLYLKKYRIFKKTA